MRAWQFALAGIFILILSGCASINTPVAAQQETTVDSAQVAAIESAARVSGVKIMWVRYPQKRVASTE